MSGLVLKETSARETSQPLGQMKIKIKNTLLNVNGSFDVKNPTH